MALAPILYVCSLFMLGRNIFSLAFKLRDILIAEKRKEWIQQKSKLFILLSLILTAILGLISGVGMLFPGQIFGQYLFFIVAGMMIYSYLNYAGNCYEEKKWVMFSVSILVILLTAILVCLLAIFMTQGYLI